MAYTKKSTSVPETVVVEVLLTGLLDLRVVELVSLPTLLADIVRPVVVLLLLDAGLILVVVELKSGVTGV